MAADDLPTAGLTTADYPALFSAYVVRSVDALRIRLTTGAALSPDAFARLRDHALHVLTFALGSDDAWPATRDLLLALAEPMEQAGARSEWLPFLTRGVERSRELVDRSAEAELSLRVGHLLRLSCNFAAARGTLTVGLGAFRQLGDDTGAARALNQLAYIDCLEHRNGAAAAQAQAALELLAADNAERAMSHFVLGMIAIDHWEWVEAERHHRAALAIRQQQGDARRIAWAQQNVGYALQGQGRYDEAIACFTAASAVLEALGDRANQAIVLMNLARTYHLDGQLTRALTTNLVAHKALQAVGDHLHLARIAGNLGLNYLALDDPRAALTAFQESAALFGALENRAGVINAISGVAMAHLALGDYAEAAALLAPALDELEPIENVPGKAALIDTMRQNLDRARTAVARP